MKFEIAEIIEQDNEKYITLSITKENEKEYAFVNKLDFDEEPTDEYAVFTIINNEIKAVVDKELVDKLLIKFQENIRKELNSIFNDNNKGE